MGEARMDRFRTDLDAGSSKFAGFEARFQAVEARQAHHSERIVVVETLLGNMNDKLDTILTALKEQHK